MVGGALDVVDRDVGRMLAIGRLCADRLVGRGLVDHQRLVRRIFLLSQRHQRVAMAGGNLHVQRAEERVVEALAGGHQSDAVRAGREIQVAARFRCDVWSAVRRRSRPVARSRRRPLAERPRRTG